MVDLLPIYQKYSLQAHLTSNAITTNTNGNGNTNNSQLNNLSPSDQLAYDDLYLAALAASNDRQIGLSSTLVLNTNVSTAVSTSVSGSGSGSGSGSSNTMSGKMTSDSSLGTSSGEDNTNRKLANNRNRNDDRDDEYAKEEEEEYGNGEREEEWGKLLRGRMKTVKSMCKRFKISENNGEMWNTNVMMFDFREYACETQKRIPETQACRQQWL